jgi:hypothetical protein
MCVWLLHGCRLAQSDGTQSADVLSYAGSMHSQPDNVTQSPPPATTIFPQAHTVAALNIEPC